MTGIYINIKEAAEMLGVSKLTLRNWDKSGKLEAHRHPINNYRVYLKEDLDKLISQIKIIERPPKKESPLKVIHREEKKIYKLNVIHEKD